MKYTVNILGSCVSRISMLNGNQSGHNIASDKMQLRYFLDKQNIATAMMPPPFTREEVDTIQREELWDKTRLDTVRQGLNKDTVSLLLEEGDDKADYLIMDLFDFQNNFVVCNNTAFSSHAYEFMNTQLCEKYRENMSLSNFMQVPTWIYYPLVDLFFEKIMTRYDADHIILIRFRANHYYWETDGSIREIPEEYKNPWQASDKYNAPLARLEDYIISKYQPYVIDLSKFYMGDHHTWDNIQGAHFEQGFYHDVMYYVGQILDGTNTGRYFDKPSLFGKVYDRVDEYREKLFDVEAALELLPQLVEAEDVLWLNVLDKLNYYAPQDTRVQMYMEIIHDDMEN